MIDDDVKTREFASVVAWEDLQYARTDKKPKPPWPWFRIQLDMLRSPLWCSMTKTQRADFIAICGAASQTGNLIPIDDKRWLRNFDLTQKNVRTLRQLGLISVQTLRADDKRIKDMRSALSVRRTSPEGEGEAEAEADTEIPSPSSDERTPVGGNFNGEWKQLNDAVVQAAKALERNDVEEDDDELRNQTEQHLGADLTDNQWMEAVKQVDQNGLHLE